ncbi:MAG: HAMP domain-containing histidine kinase [Deltaproteobacteria bacterium]|nr:HAMP domain-containing histidine kinase [Deltaproteobacteria bacterium]
MPAIAARGSQSSPTSQAAPSDVSRLVRRTRDQRRSSGRLRHGERLLLSVSVLTLVTVGVSLVLVVRAGPTQQFGTLIALHLAVLLLVTGLLAMALSQLQRSAARLTVLRDVATELGVGDLAVRAPTEPLDDFGQLGLGLNVMADRIGRLLQAQRDLLAGVSHELRSPLARIEVALELIRLEFERSRASAPGGVERRRSEGEQLVEEVEEEVRLLERHIARLLEAQRIGAEGPLPQRREFALDRLVAVVVERERRRLKGLSWQLELALTLGDARLMGDENALDRVLSTLIENAVQHAGEGVDPTGRPAQRELRIETRRDESGAAVVAVLDRGPGLQPDECQLVFEAFYRTDRSRSTTTGGTGLGLYLVKRIAESHGGSVRAMPREGGGLAIEVRLPLLSLGRESKDTIRMAVEELESVGGP